MTRGPTWQVPMELVRSCLTAAATAALVRAELRGGLFQPHAEVERTAEGFVATVTFDEPRFPGRRQEMGLQLFAPLRENAR